MNTIFNDTFFAMGTRCDVVLPGTENQFAENVFQLVKNEIIHLENRLSRFIYNSPISEINRVPKNKWIDLPDDLWDVITICYDFYQMSNGAFDITATQLVKLWQSDNIPGNESILNALEKTGFNNVEFDFEKQKIRFYTDGVEFDLGAIGKGIALDGIKPLLEKQGIKDAIISFGESSILALGNHPNGEYWPLGIRNFLNPEEFIHVFEAKNHCITSSATLLTNDDGDIISRKHIISPESAKPIAGNKAVSVKSESATFGEFLSTAWLILPENDKEILSAEFKNIEILEVDYSNPTNPQSRLSVFQ